MAAWRGGAPEALVDVYYERILRGNEQFNWSKLGAFGSELAILSAFFGPPWERFSPGLDEKAEAFVLNQAGLSMQAVGRLADAVRMMQLSLEQIIAQEDWKNAAQVVGNLSRLRQDRGELSEALSYGQQSVELADKSGDAVKRALNRTTLAGVLHAAGRREEAAALFSEAERMQREDDPTRPLLYSNRGYQYCDLLLDQGQEQDVMIRAAQTLPWEKGRLLDSALDRLSIGRAHLLAALRDTGGELTEATAHIKHAVEGLRSARMQSYLPVGLLARAALRIHTGDLVRARVDLDEALRIATRCGFRLHETDAHLGYARLHLAERHPAEAQMHLAKARALVEATSYHRRDDELARLEAQAREMANAAPSPIPASSVPPPVRAPLTDERSAPMPQDDILFAWAHLGDTQFGAPDAAGHRMMLAALAADLAAAPSRSCPPLDAILVTGDIAYAGREEQYAEAEAWLPGIAQKAGIPRERVYVVPGNHDVDWSAAQDRNVARLARSLRDGAEPIDRAIEEESDLLARPLGTTSRLVPVSRRTAAGCSGCRRSRRAPACGFASSGSPPRSSRRGGTTGASSASATSSSPPASSVPGTTSSSSSSRTTPSTADGSGTKGTRTPG
jgi:tetratricopeptide (TPR) repeat protein